MRGRTRLAMALALSLMAAGGCGDGDDGGSDASARPAEGSALSTSTPAGDAGRDGAAAHTESTATTVRVAGGHGRGCPDNGGQVPDGVVEAGVMDVDGDGRRDEVWYQSTGAGQRVGLSTASGAVVGYQVDTAKPVFGVRVVDADQRGPVEVLVDKGATIDLLVFQLCDLVPVIGPDGDPYEFDNGYLGNGTGVSCIDTDRDGRRDVVGVNLEHQGGDTYRVSRTVVVLDDATARHGDHDQITVQLGPSDRSYRGIDCGPLDLTEQVLTP